MPTPDLQSDPFVGDRFLKELCHTIIVGVVLKFYISRVHAMMQALLQTGNERREQKSSSLKFFEEEASIRYCILVVSQINSIS